MNELPLTDRRILPVSIVAGPSAGALLRQIAARGEKRALILQASSDEQQAFAQIIAVAEQGEVDHLLIECNSQMPAMAYASLFLSPPLTEMAQLTQTVLAIRSSDLLDLLVRRVGRGQVGAPGFLVEQLEFASDIVLEGGVDNPDFKLARDVARTLNPNAQVSDLSRDTLLSVRGGADPTSFDFAAALDGAGWRQLIDGEPLPQGEESSVDRFAYHSRRPFHPARFWTLLQSGLPGVIRAKGFFWLATRMDLVGGLNLAGSEMHCAAAGEWWAARDEQTREHEMPQRTRKEWKEPFGDRRQAIAFMGLDADPDACKAQLDAALLTEAEMSAGPEHWATLSDPFPSWSVHSHSHECNHDHDSGEHECCHHH